LKCQHQHEKNAFVTHEAHRQGKRVYQVDIDFRSAFNTMLQAALWHLMNMFHIPDVEGRIRVSVMVYRLARTRKTAVKTPNTAII